MSEEWVDACPFPKVAEYVIAFWNSRGGGLCGRIRTVPCSDLPALTSMQTSWVPSRNRLVLGCDGGNRWCDAIGRQHKCGVAEVRALTRGCRSNQVYFEVDPERRCFTQRCWDADCRAGGARSNDFPIPAACFDSVRADRGAPFSLRCRLWLALSHFCVMTSSRKL